MPGIRILPDRVANQIAAGEVVERPAAVVKELVENGLDAGATRIDVAFRDGGRSLMRVADNGGGMGREDALLALERHATSKIAVASDLDRLTTFGFRGEALPSIASVSRFLLQTRTAEEEAGTEILVNGGKTEHVRACGRPVGTTVEVAHLFHPVPARRKFLKTDRTESAHIIQCVRLYALAFPGVAFTLAEDGREVFRSPACTTLAERVGEIFGAQLAAELLPIDAAEPGLRLSGLIGRPGIGRASRHEMITFVNSRPVDSRALNYALLESYQQSVPKGRYPAAFIFVECNPAAVDVNVHPAKREVRFRDETAVRGFVIRSVLGRIRELTAPAPALTPRASAPSVPTRGPLFEPQRAPTVPQASPAPRAAVPDRLEDPPPAPQAPAARPPGPGWRLLGLAHGATAVFETPAGLVLLDRRAAQERVWFERLRLESETGRAQGQRLLLPVPVELDPIATAFLLDRQAFLRGHGFEVTEFGRNFFRIEAIPAWMEPSDAETFLRDLLAAMREGKITGKDLDVARGELARLASARALRLPATASPAELEALAAELFSTSAPLTSPSGRPTCIELNQGELSRRFQR
jgi:DNA mismatch repair protein MutL